MEQGMSRTDRPSDLICSDFLERDGFCQWQNRCVRAHLRSTQIYHTLLQSVKVRYFCPRSRVASLRDGPSRCRLNPRHPWLLLYPRLVKIPWSSCPKRPTTRLSNYRLSMTFLHST